jgi:cytochrome c-type biogenesis protein CcsB
VDYASLESISFTITFLTFMAASFLYMVYLVQKNEKLGDISTAVTGIGFVANTAVLIFRWLDAGRPPFTSGYEFLMCFTWGIIIAYLFAEWKYKLKVIGAFVLPTAWLLTAYIAVIMPPEQRAAQEYLMPALQSNWLHIHVITAMFSYGAFAVSLGTSIMYLIKESLEKGRSRGDMVKRLPSLEILDDLSYKFIAFGFPLLSIVIISGAIWAEYAWGRYWSWDPKETWSLITWLVYAAYLHARFTYGWRGSRAAIMSIVGFLFVLFTFFGVNYFLAGIHSYGGG